MEENKQNKTKLSTFIIVLAVLVIIIMAGFIYMQKVSSDREIAGLKNDAEGLKATVAELQGKLDSISNLANSEEEVQTKNNQKDEETTKNTSKITVKQKEEDSDTIATLYSNNKVTIKLKKSDKSQMWKYYVEDWKNAEYDKEYDVNGINGVISKILLTNFPASDVEPALIILSEDSKISYVDFSELIIDAAKKKITINGFTAKEKANNMNNIVDIKTSTNGSIVAIDKSGKEIPIWRYGDSW